MEFVYRYAARGRTGRTVEGVVFASGEMDARERLRQVGNDPFELKLDISATLGAITQREFNLRELSRFYGVISKRLERGHGNLVQGLVQAQDFITDPRLLTAISMMRESVNDGARMSEAMRMAGFSEKDASAVASLETVGKLPEALASLAREANRDFQLKSNLASVARTPKFFFVLFFTLLYGILVFVAPRMEKFFSQLTGVELPAFAKTFYAFAGVFNAHLLVSSLVYLATGVGFFIFVHSQIFKSFLYRVPAFNKLSERADLGSLWGSFALLIYAGQNLPRSADMLAGAASRPDNRQRFETLSYFMRTGMPLDQAVSNAEFPPYIVNAVAAAQAGGGDVSEGLRQLSIELMEDVVVLSERVGEFVKHGMLIVMSFAVLLFFMLTYYPVLSSVMSQL